jgi:hypothetical protein
MSYLPMSDSELQAMASVLYAEGLACYCSKECANLGVYKELQSRGIKNTGGSIGPVTSCAKCSCVIDMTQPHVHYVKMEVTVNKTPSQTNLTVHDDEGLADICINCDPDGAVSATTEKSEPIKHTVIPLLRA